MKTTQIDWTTDGSISDAKSLLLQKGFVVRQFLSLAKKTLKNYPQDYLQDQNYYKFDRIVKMQIGPIATNR